jgi:transposase
MANRKYSNEFREEAVKQITERGYSVKEVSNRLGVSTKSLYKWLGGVRGHRATEKANSLEAENARLKSELKRVEEERDILKKAARYFAKASG